MSSSPCFTGAECTIQRLYITTLASGFAVAVGFHGIRPVTSCATHLKQLAESPCVKSKARSQSPRKRLVAATELALKSRKSNKNGASDGTSLKTDSPWRKNWFQRFRPFKIFLRQALAKGHVKGTGRRNDNDLKTSTPKAIAHSNFRSSCWWSPHVNVSNGEDF